MKRLTLVAIIIPIIYICNIFLKIQNFKSNNQYQRTHLFCEYPESWEKMPSLYNGWLDGGVWNRVLTQEEINFLANK